MKKSLALMICVFLLAGPASAQMYEADVQKSIAAAKRSGELRDAAVSRAMEECSTTRTAYSYPSYSHSFSGFDVTLKEETRQGVISVKWTGGCVDGRRNGPGVLSWTEERDDGQGNNEKTAWRSEGHFVNGQRLGMWCMTKQFQFTSEGRSVRETSDSGCSVFAGHLNPLTGNYRQQPDRRWRLHSGDGSPTDSFLAAGALEAQSTKLLADADAGKADLKAVLVVQSQSLDGLVRGSKIVLSLSAAPISLKDKRVAILLSSRAVSEFDRFKRERQALIDASAGLRGEAAAERAKFIQASDPGRLLINS